MKVRACLCIEKQNFEFFSSFRQPNNDRDRVHGERLTGYIPA